MDCFVPASSSMHWSLNEEQLAEYIVQQLGMFSNPNRRFCASDIARHLPTACDRVERCFRQIRRKYFFDGEKTIFDHRHGDHYAMFLYLLANSILKETGPGDLVDSLFLMNKMLHGLDLYPVVELPEVFLLVHPVGTVLGNATYGNHFVAYQGCSVGSLEDGVYPSFAGETVLFARSAVLGDSVIGRNVVIGANTFILNTGIPADRTVVGSFPTHRVLPNNQSVVDRMFRCL